MKEAQKNMKRQFDKKRQNPQRLKVGKNVWLENKNIQLNRPSKKLDNKRYRSFRISKDIGSGAFQLELPEGWAIHNMFNEDLLTQCVELMFKGQCCGNHLSQRQMITQTVNLLVEYQVGNSQENSTRSLFLIRVLFIQKVHGLCY